jgi:hypothetical protein
MANVVAHNEITDFFRKKDNQNVLFSQMNESVSQAVSAVESPGAIAGNSAPEIRSLLKPVWKAAQSLSLRQKYAYFLPFPDFIVEFIAYRCCSIEELAAYFESSEQELSEIIDALPISEDGIGALLTAKLNQQISMKQLWEARSKAKAKLAERLKEYISDERLSEQRRT